MHIFAKHARFAILSSTIPGERVFNLPLKILLKYLKKGTIR